MLVLGTLLLSIAEEKSGCQIFQSKFFEQYRKLLRPLINPRSSRGIFEDFQDGYFKKKKTDDVILIDTLHVTFDGVPKEILIGHTFRLLM